MEPTWVVSHAPHDYQYPDVYGPFKDRTEAEDFIDTYILTQEGVFDRDDFTAQELLAPADYKEEE